MKKHNNNITRAIDLPHNYGKDRIVAMIRDPWWIFVYWEITKERLDSVQAQLKDNNDNFKESVLRVYEMQEGNQSKYFDITIQNMARNWYIDVGSPGKSWCIEIGLVSQQGNFYMLARSNVITTPPFGMSEVQDETWALTEDEYWWSVGVSGGFDVGKSSFEMKELFQKQLQSWVSSGGLFTLGSHIVQHSKV